MLKVGVLSVQGAVSEHLQHLERSGVEALAVKDAVSLEQVCGLIIPGGESTTIGKLIEAFGLAARIRERSLNGTLALFGTCAGMILLAKSITDGMGDQPKLGLMDIRVQRNAFGRQRESFEAELNFDGIDQPLTGVFIRAPLIREAGEGVEILAELEEGVVAARQGSILVTSFHPELTGDLSVHRYFVGMCRNLSRR